jgi:aldehyde:ferredoxin oxidoreductase
MNDAGVNTLPSFNAQQLGYSQADLGSPVILKALRKGKTACAWCKVACRHFHYIEAEYAPTGKDLFLDDFEPAYAIYAMLGLTPDENSLAGKLGLFAEINSGVIKPIEEMGLDIINMGIAIAALCEGIEKKIIPQKDIPESLRSKKLLGNKDAVIEMITLLMDKDTDTFPALLAAASHPEALVELYPDMRDIVFTCGKNSLGNPGHCNTLWTFLMPFSRYFGHYVGQIYKIDEELPHRGAKDIEYIECFHRVINKMLQREYYWLMGNALSQCSFTFIIFSEDARGEKLRKDSLLPRLLSHYGIKTTNHDLEWFSQAFWCQSMNFKYNMGWRPPTNEDFPFRVYEALSIALDRGPGEIKRLMGILIGIWKEKARSVLARFGYTIPWT